MQLLSQKYQKTKGYSLIQTRKAFNFFDEDKSGKISLKNLKRVAREIGEPLTDDYLREMLEDADRDGDGEINQAEFMRIMRRVEDFE